MCQKMGISEEFERNFFVDKAKIDEIHKAIPRISTIFFYVLIVESHSLLSELQ